MPRCLLCEFAGAAVTALQAGWLTWQKWTVSQFWGWMSKISVSAGLLLLRAVKGGPGPGLSPWLEDGRLLPVSLHVVLPLCVSLVHISPFCEDTGHIGLVTLVTSFNWITSAKTLSQNKVTVLGPRGLAFNI